MLNTPLKISKPLPNMIDTPIHSDKQSRETGVQDNEEQDLFNS